MKLCRLLFILLFPSASFAAVEISEVAWMGSSGSPNHEWIELHNTGSEVAVDGWLLHDENSLTIELEGVIPGNSRVVLERTSDTSAPGSAFLLYTGALGNGGVTLVLRNNQGDVVDQVAGGVDWKNIGGDNITKETAQLQDSTWVTAAPTPGSAPTAGATSVPLEREEAVVSKSNNNTRTVGNSHVTQLALPGISLQLAMDLPDVVHVGQTFELAVEPSGVGKTIADSLTYKWSLGNGDTRAGKEPKYAFHYPGQYVVVVAAEYKRQKQFARHTITVLPVELELTRSTDGSSFVLRNTSDTEIDIGNYRLVGTSEHVFPQYTILLPQSEVVVPVTVTTHSQAVVALYDEFDEAVAVHVPGFVEAEISNHYVEPDWTGAASLSSQVSVPPTDGFGFVSDTAPKPPQPVVPVQPATLGIVPQVAAAASSDDNPIQNNWPTYMLIALLILGTIGIYLVPQKKDDPPWV